MQPVARQCTSVLRFEEKAIVARLRCTCKYLQLILLVVLLGCIVRPSSPRGPVSEARSQLRSRCSSSISSSRTAPRTSTTQGSALRTEVSRPTRAVCVVSWTCHGPNLAALLGAESAEPLERCVDASWQEGGRAVQRPSTTHHLVQQVTGVAGARALGEHEGRVVLAAVSIVGANVPWAAGVHVGAVHAAARAVRAIGPDSITVAASRENAARLHACSQSGHSGSRGGGLSCAVAPGSWRSVSMCRVHSSRVTQTLASSVDLEAAAALARWPRAAAGASACVECTQAASRKPWPIGRLYSKLLQVYALN